VIFRRITALACLLFMAVSYYPLSSLHNPDSLPKRDYTVPSYEETDGEAYAPEADALPLSDTAEVSGAGAYEHPRAIDLLLLNGVSLSIYHKFVGSSA